MIVGQLGANSCYFNVWWHYVIKCLSLQILWKNAFSSWKIFFEVYFHKNDCIFATWLTLHWISKLFPGMGTRA